MTEDRRGLSIKIQSLSPARLWAAAMLLSAAAVLAVTGVAVFALRGSVLWVGWQPVLLAVGVACMIPVIGLLPLLGANRREPIKTAQAAQMANAIRLGVAAVAVLVVLVLLPDKPAKVAFGVWMIGLYLVSLVVELSVLAVWLKAKPEDMRV